MFSFCLDHGLFGFIFLSVSSACSVFVSSSYPSHPRAPSSFHLVSETKRIKDPPLPSLLREGDFKGDTKPPSHLSMSRRILCGGMSGGYFTCVAWSSSSMRVSQKPAI